MKDQLTIVIPAHDSHSDIVLLLQRCLDQFWPDCPYQIYWTNCEAELQDKRIKIIHNGNTAAFAKRVLSALMEIETEYILLWVEDFLPTKRIDTTDIEKVLQYMNKHQCNYCALRKCSKRSMKKDPETPSIYKIAANRPYGVSINCGIFKREYLISMINDENWNVWELEISFLRQASNKMLKKCIYLDGGMGDLVNLLTKGKIEPLARNKLEKAGISLTGIDREPLPAGQVIKNTVVSFCGQICPVSTRKYIKKIAGHLGIKLASEY